MRTSLPDTVTCTWTAASQYAMRRSNDKFETFWLAKTQKPSAILHCCLPRSSCHMSLTSVNITTGHSTCVNGDMKCDSCGLSQNRRRFKVQTKSFLPDPSRLGKIFSPVLLLASVKILGWELVTCSLLKVMICYPSVKNSANHRLTLHWY